MKRMATPILSKMTITTRIELEPWKTREGEEQEEEQEEEVSPVNANMQVKKL